MKTSLSINIDQRNLYADVVDLLNESPVNIEAKRLIISLVSKQLEAESDKIISEELKKIKEANDEPVVD